MLLVKKAMSVGLGDFFLESTGPNWTFLTLIERLPPNHLYLYMYYKMIILFKKTTVFRIGQRERRIIPWVY